MVGVLLLTIRILEKKAGWGLFSWTSISAELREVLLPFAQRNSVPVMLQQEREKSSGLFKSVEHCRSCLLQLCPQNWADGSLLPSWSWDELCSLVPWVFSCEGGWMADIWKSKCIHWTWFCGDTRLGGGQARAGLGCPGDVPALRSLQDTAMVPAAGSLPILLHGAALEALPGCHHWWAPALLSFAEGGICRRRKKKGLPRPFALWWSLETAQAARDQLPHGMV